MLVQSTVGLAVVIFGWLVVLFCAAVTIRLLRGRGASLVAGYRSLSELERAGYPLTAKQVSIRAGKIMVPVTVILTAYFAVLSFAQSARVIEWASLILLVGLAAVAAAAVALGRKR
ncbi:MAG: DUF3784 domain-containing protein [Firmicutes bacterium]|nr:DUF3784 domain-containing protein [Bacillota bacterium]